MAKRTSSRGGSRGKSTAGRQTKSRKAPATASAEVEVVEEAGGPGIDAGIAVVTTLVLLAAILFVDAHLGRYGGGMFFK